MTAVEKLVSELREELEASARQAEDATRVAAEQHALEMQKVQLERSKMQVGRWGTG